MGWWIMRGFLNLLIWSLALGQTSYEDREKTIEPVTQQESWKALEDILADPDSPSIFDSGYEDAFPRLSVSVPEGFGEQTLPDAMVDCAALGGNTEYIECSDVGWEAVDGGQFPDSQVYLAVRNTSIKVLRPESFEGKTILVLAVSEHRNFSVSLDALRGSREVQVVHLTDNEWTIRDEDHFFFEPFKHLPNLTQLVIERNALSFKDIDKTRKHEEVILPNLEYLSLMDNNLYRLEEFIFYPLRGSPLTQLNLQAAGLLGVHRRAFEYLPYLEHVDFFNNRNLILMPSYTYSFQASLKPLGSSLAFRHLGMGDMGLAWVPNFSINSLNKRLERLNLSKNKLSDIGYLAPAFGADAFPMMENLTELILQENDIVDVHPKTFVNMPNLKILDLKGNKLSTVFEGLMMPSLEFLDLSSQCERGGILGGECDEERFKILPGVFANMSNLRTLHMTGAHMPFPAETIFTGLTGLKSLRLDSSELQFIPGRMLGYLPSLEVLDLSNNQDLRGFTSETFEGLDNLEILDLSYSSRAFSDLAPKIQRTQSDIMKEALSNKALKRVNLRCALNEDCSSDIDYASPLDEELLKTLPDLVHLDLSENALASWEEDIFIFNDNLASLNLARNSMVFLTEGMLNSFRRLRVLDMRSNPIYCDENVVEFHRMSYEVEGLFIVGYNGGEGYTCTRKDSLNEDVTFKEFYDDTSKVELVPEDEKGLTTLQVVFISLSCLGAVVLGIVLYVGVSNRYFIAYNILKSRKKLKTLARDPESNDFSYDVFVCHSKADRQWVLEELVPALEKEEPPVKVCVHERDFEVGVSVTENIVDSIHKSRKFLVVLSDGYCQSKWCRFETQVAQERGGKGELGEDFVVVVMEEPDHKRLSKDMRHILNNRTYLRWEEGDLKRQMGFYVRLRQSILKEKEEWMGVKMTREKS